MKILPSEDVICGGWALEDGRLVADANCARIDQLIGACLRLLGRDASGWDALYVDPEDGRLWELTYPRSELHGGGAPRLAVLTREEAVQRYAAEMLGADHLR